MEDIVVGVLALQGAFEKHVQVLRSLQVQAKRIRVASELKECDGLIIPGGESTTMSALIHRMKFEKPLREFARKKPVLGVCAGIILLAKESKPFPGFSLNTLDISVQRNGYGSQIESFVSQITIPWKRKKVPFPTIFIRAPKIVSVGKEIEVLAMLDNQIIAVRHHMQMGLTFHPELTDDPLFHQLFLKMVKKYKTSESPKELEKILA